ncbi:MAG: hypothetical protein AAFV53_04750 [Myxococcota bacterium]
MTASPSPHITAAVERIAAGEPSPLRRAEALVEVAVDLQRQPRDPQQLVDAIFLYDQAARMAADAPLAYARATAGKGSALRRMPGAGLDVIVAARDAFEEALPLLRARGEPEEVAEVEMSYGLVLQTLAGAHKAPLPHAIQAYQRALRFFNATQHPREYAILHNNLATAYLSMRMDPQRGPLREALAVQSFQEALRCVTLESDPVEYAMLQNNLGNALQATRTTRPFEHLTRAVEAYDEALKVRTAYDTPVEFANTIANKANALMNLPDDPDEPGQGNPDNLNQAVGLLAQARDVFARHQLADRAQVVEQLRAQLAAELEVAGALR